MKKNKKKTILPPKITKFKKQTKGKGILTPFAWKKTTSQISYGVYGIQILKSIRLTLKQLETTRRQVSKFLTKSECYWFRVNPDIPVTKKPNEIRMGKGKGALAFWAVRLNAGQTLVELNYINSTKANAIYSAVSRKFPSPCVLIKNKTKIL